MLINNLYNIVEDEVKVDLGSWAWKASGFLLLDFLETINGKIDNFETIENEGLYGVIFIK